jgi:hypothetical protein
LKKRVAIILTGELRYIDYCFKWWSSVVEKSDYNVDFFSSTWNEYSESVSLDSKFKEEFDYKVNAEGGITNAVRLMCPGVNSICTPDNYLNRYVYPAELTKHGSYNYYFGRTAQLYRAITTWNFDLSQYDVVVHSRWDTAFRNTNDFNSFIKICEDGISFRSLQIDKGNVYACDWAYGGPASEMLDIYGDIDLIQNHIDIFNELYEKDFTAATTFLIGHNLYSTYIARQLKSIKPSNHSATLVRKHNLDFEYSDNQWTTLNGYFLESTTGY